MGCCFSCKRLSSSSSMSSKSSVLKNIIRVVHLNGYMEEFDYPVTVAELIGKPPSHFLFTQAQLLEGGSTSLKPDAHLEPGRVYFLLPSSLFDSNVSPLDLAPVARKLAAATKKNRSKTKPEKLNLSSSAGGNSPVWRSPGRSRSLVFLDSKMDSGSEESSGSRLWKPVLCTIHERSFNRREPDLLEIVKV